MGATKRTTESWARMSGAVLEYIEQHGSFRGLLIPNQGKQKLVIAVIEEGLIVSDKTLGRYDLTTAVRAYLAEHRHKIAAT